jgi:hypothetical protein
MSEPPAVEWLNEAARPLTDAHVALERAAAIMGILSFLLEVQPHPGGLREVELKNLRIYKQTKTKHERLASRMRNHTYKELELINHTGRELQLMLENKKPLSCFTTIGPGGRRTDNSQEEV